MIVIDDEEFAEAIRNALNADPETTTKVIALMVAGCSQIERFEEAVQFAREAPFSPEASVDDFNSALDEAREAFGDLIDIFGDVLDIATGVRLNREA
jgi:hypothetical protein